MSEPHKIWIEETEEGPALYVGTAHRFYRMVMKEPYQSLHTACFVLEQFALGVMRKERSLTKEDEPTPCPSHPHSKTDDMGCRACVLGWPAEEEECEATEEAP